MKENQLKSSLLNESRNFYIARVVNKFAAFFESMLKTSDPDSISNPNRKHIVFLPRNFFSKSYFFIILSLRRILFQECLDFLTFEYQSYSADCFGSHFENYQQTCEVSQGTV